MLYKRKVTAKYILPGLILLMLIALTINMDAKDKHFKGILKSLTDDDSDTTKHRGRKNASPVTTDTTKKNLVDTLQTDSAKKAAASDTLTLSKDSLSAPINYKAEDSAVLIIPSKQFFLYGKGNVVYKDMTLDANTIQYNQETQLVTAYGGVDTGHNPLNLPKLTQGKAESKSDTIKFNMKNQRGRTINTYYKEGEMFVFASVVKKVDPITEYAFKGRFTTCNLDTPHFAFRVRKMKIINDKIAVTGPAMPEFEGVPIPIVIPFGIFPLERGRHSGFLPPAFTNDFSKGLGLQGLGYYKVINDYWDLTVRSDLYTYGGWTLDLKPDYFKRYEYRGTLDLSIQKTKTLNTSGLDPQEFTTASTYFLTWTHSSDQRARPGTSFSASVRAGSTKYNQLQTFTSSFRNYQNQLASSITYSKTWDNGKYNLSIAADHNQNNNLGLINIEAPTVNFTATTIYPFQKKDQAGALKWYQKIGISYSGEALNQFAFYDSIFSFKKLLDTAMWGFDHRIPITLTLPALGPFLASPSISYEERWYGQQTIKTWDAQHDTLLTKISRGFYAARQVNFGFSVNTRIFGTYKFNGGNLVAIRHEVKPFISFSYQPGLVNKYYHYVQVDNQKDSTQYSTLDGGIIGSFPQGTFGGISFGIDNLLEMKVKDKSDTSTSEDGTKKIRLLDDFGISGGYNFLADSLQWSPLTLNVRSTIGKVNITGGATIDPYGVDSLGRRINKLLWTNGNIGRFTGGNLAVSTSLKSKATDGKTDAARVTPDATLTPEEQQAQLDYVRQNPAEFVDFNIPWTLQLSLAVNFSRVLAANLLNYYTQISSNLNLNGDFSLSPKWKIGGGTYFDFRQLKVQAINMFLTREMHCWQMSISLQLGAYKSFSIVLNPKSGILRDLKINRTRSFASY